jgi:hypothetical protein
VLSLDISFQCFIAHFGEKGFCLGELAGLFGGENIAIERNIRCAQQLRRDGRFLRQRGSRKRDA